MINKETNDWIPVSNLEIGFDENKLPANDELGGQEIKLFFDSGQVLKYTFQDGKHLTWEIIKGLERGASGKETYEAIKLIPGLYFIDFVKKKESRVSVTLTLDMKKQRALIIQARIPTRREANRSFLKRMNQGLNLSPTRVEIMQATVNKSNQGKKSMQFERTNDLIGKQVLYTYSRQHCYEHYYINHRFFTWHCLNGPEKGTADTDSCDHFKIAPDVYQFIWREKVVPTVGIELTNFKQMRSTGKIFGLDIPTGKAVNFTMGAYAEIIAEKKR